MRGETVIIRAFGNEQLIRKVWDENNRVVFVTNEEQFKLLISGENTIQPIGLPREDVFKYNDIILIYLKQNKQLEWSELIPY